MMSEQEFTSFNFVMNQSEILLEKIRKWLLEQYPENFKDSHLQYEKLLSIKLSESGIELELESVEMEIDVRLKSSDLG